jgi:hypothetical protein
VSLLCMIGNALPLVGRTATGDPGGTGSTCATTTKLSLFRSTFSRRSRSPPR